jgi:hypothetical protein
VVTALREHAFPRSKLVPNARPVGCPESWVAYLARCARQRRCLEAPPIAGGKEHTLFVDAAGRLLSCGKGAAVGHEVNPHDVELVITPVAAMAEVRVRQVVAGPNTALPSAVMAGSTRGAMVGSTRRAWWGILGGKYWAKERDTPVLSRRWWTDLQACVPSPRRLIIVSP